MYKDKVKQARRAESRGSVRGPDRPTDSNSLQIKSFIHKKVDWKPWANLTFGGRERAYASSHMHGMITDAQVVIIVIIVSSSIIIVVNAPFRFSQEPCSLTKPRVTPAAPRSSSLKKWFMNFS